MPDPSPVVVRRWTRFGHDRLYVSGSGAEQIGWTDLQTGTAHPAAPEWLPALRAAEAEWKARTRWEAGPTSALADRPSGSTPVGPDVPHSPASSPAVGAPVEPVRRAEAVVVPDGLASTSVRPWSDLAANAPGAAAQERATALRDAAPVRTFFARLLNRKTPERAWRVGAHGERLVAAKLARLVRSDPRWRVLHAIRVGEGESDIDHLVLGPGGVFTLNAKHHPDGVVWVAGETFMVNGQRYPYVRNSRHEAARAARLLTAATGVPIGVDGVIVPVRARTVTIKSAPDQVAVVQRQQLTKWLLGHSEVLDHQALAAIWEAARRSTTWRPGEAQRLD